MRSEFQAAHAHLSSLIAHCRTMDIWTTFAPKVTLYHAYLAHSEGKSDQAILYYRVAAQAAEERGQEHIRVGARAGEIAIRLGMLRDPNAMDVDESKEEEQQIIALGKDVVEAAMGLGGTMRSVGKIVEACLIKGEILSAKYDPTNFRPELVFDDYASRQHLKSALAEATNAVDNHLKALILCLISAHFFHTAPDYALKTLGLAHHIAAGFGAAPKDKDKDKSKGKLRDAVGNAPLRTWIGEKSLGAYTDHCRKMLIKNIRLEIYRRKGDKARAQRQEATNRALLHQIEKEKDATDICVKGK